MLFIFLLNTSYCNGIVGPVTQGQSLWFITKNVANTVDIIETKLDSLENEIDVLLVNNQVIQSKLDTIITGTPLESLATLNVPSPGEQAHKDAPPSNNQSTFITTPQSMLQVHCFNAGNGTTIININGMNPSPQQNIIPPQLISNRSKYMALLKIISGITLTTASLIYGGIAGSIATTLGFLDHEFGLLVIGPILIVASFPLEYVGYKLVKNGLHDLKEFAQWRKRVLRSLTKLRKT